jgi:hypothetical protein
MDCSSCDVVTQTPQPASGASGNGTRRASLTMMFKVAQSAENRWRRLNGHEQLIPLLQ